MIANNCHSSILPEIPRVRPHFKPQIEYFHLSVFLHLHRYIDPLVRLERHECDPKLILLILNGLRHAHRVVELVEHVERQVAHAETVLAEFLVGDEGDQFLEVRLLAQRGHLAQADEQRVGLVEASGAEAAEVGGAEAAPVGVGAGHAAQEHLQLCLLRRDQAPPRGRRAVEHEAVDQVFAVAVVALVLLQLPAQLADLLLQEQEGRLERFQLVAQLDLQLLDLDGLLLDRDAVEVEVGEFLVPALDLRERLGQDAAGRRGAPLGNVELLELLRLLDLEVLDQVLDALRVLLLELALGFGVEADQGGAVERGVVETLDDCEAGREVGDFGDVEEGPVERAAVEHYVLADQAVDEVLQHLSVELRVDFRAVDAVFDDAFDDSDGSLVATRKPIFTQPAVHNFIDDFDVVLPLFVIFEPPVRSLPIPD